MSNDNLFFLCSRAGHELVSGSTKRCTSSDTYNINDTIIHFTLPIRGKGKLLFSKIYFEITKSYFGERLARATILVDLSILSNILSSDFVARIVITESDI